MWRLKSLSDVNNNKLEICDILEARASVCLIAYTIFQIDEIRPRSGL